MKIILSRKGFDSVNGKCASPVIGNQMISMPIPNPEGDSNYKYSDLRFGNDTYLDILQSLHPKFENARCHVDPDIREGVIAYDGWKPAFGQIDAAQTHLKNQGVSAGDLFLFFGWFRETEYNQDGALVYKKNSKDFHAIYGYMQIGEILKGESIKSYPWHPHSSVEYFEKEKNNNTLYIPSPQLIIHDQCLDMPGYGTLDFCELCILTQKGYSPSRWKVFEWLNETPISYHTSNNFKGDYFQSAGRGQEFVIPENESAIHWAKNLILGSRRGL